MTTQHTNVTAIAYRYPLDSLLDDPDGLADLDASSLAYGAAVRAALRAAYPSADLDVGATGYGATRISVLRDDALDCGDLNEDEHEEVRRIGQEVWERMDWVVPRDRESLDEATAHEARALFASAQCADDRTRPGAEVAEDYRTMTQQLIDAMDLGDDEREDARDRYLAVFARTWDALRAGDVVDDDSLRARATDKR